MMILPDVVLSAVSEAARVTTLIPSAATSVNWLTSIGSIVVPASTPSADTIMSLVLVMFAVCAMTLSIVTVEPAITVICPLAEAEPLMVTVSPAFVFAFTVRLSAFRTFATARLPAP